MHNKNENNAACHSTVARLAATIAMVVTLCLDLNAAETQSSNEGHLVAKEAAWCWFADPRALHFENNDSSINMTYVGYIDSHGNIKATQYDFNNRQQQEILIRSYFQPDDHDNPTFLVLPDERVMVFYSRHTDEPCFYYRISQKKGDITTLGAEKKIETKDNTTYPSPFILSSDPTHIYLCWRGINWHPTIAKLSLPDKNDNVTIEWGPYQMVQSTGARPYAKYYSDGKDKIYLTYTTGHPDQEHPDYLYFNYIDIPTLQLRDVEGHKLTSIAEGPLRVNKSNDYIKQYPATVVDHSGQRDWVWQVVPDIEGRPVIAMVRISGDKRSHNYYQARWTGQEWKKSFVAHAGGHFHQTPNIELCYSGGMAIDPQHTNTIYCSVPVEGQYGRQYEIQKVSLAESGEIISTQAITRNSQKGNARPYIIPNSEGTPLRLTWMHGDYYDWIVSKERTAGYPTDIHADFAGFTSAIGNVKEITKEEAEKITFDPKHDMAIAVDITPSYESDCTLLKLGKLQYRLNAATLTPSVVYKKTYTSTNKLATADEWQRQQRATNGKWYAPQPIKTFRLTLTYRQGVLRTYINNLLDQTITIKKR